MKPVVKHDIRLTTQNLLVSARFAEKERSPDWEAVRDLSLLIDMYCLYDGVVVLGRQVAEFLQRSDSMLCDLLAKEPVGNGYGFVHIENPTGKLAEAVSKDARARILAQAQFVDARGLGGEDLEGIEDLIAYALSPPAAEYGLSYLPDRGEEVQGEASWLRTILSYKDILRRLREETEQGRGKTFVVRSYLYASYASESKLVFAPDTAREPIIGSIVQREHDLRAQLSGTIDSAWQKFPGMDSLQLKGNIPMLAAIVFERAKPDRSLIVPHMKKLREELTPLRTRLQEAERVIFSGAGDSIVDQVNEWNEILRELARSHGTEPHLLSVDQLLQFGPQVGELFEKPHSQKAMANVLLGLPFDIVKRMIYRGPIIQLNRIRRERPAAGTFRQTINSLFGI